MIISHKYKFIFFRNGKTGTSSIGSELARFNEMPEGFARSPGLWSVKHMPPAVARALLPAEVWQSYFKFVFVRDPVDWFVSYYKYNFRKRDISAKDWIANLRGSAEAHRRNRLVREFLAVSTFDEIHVDLMAQELREFRASLMADTLYQSTYVYDEQGNRLVDFVGRFECLQEDVGTCAERIGLDINLRHRNASIGRTGAESFSSSGMKRLLEIWQKDFELLGYHKPEF